MFLLHVAAAKQKTHAHDKLCVRPHFEVTHAVQNAFQGTVAAKGCNLPSTVNAKAAGWDSAVHNCILHSLPS